MQTAKSSNASPQPEDGAPRPAGARWRDSVAQVLRSLGSTMLLTAAMVGAVLLMSGGPLAAGEQVEFALTDVDGRAVSGQSLRGKPAVLYFWATWCAACKVTTGSVEGFAARHRSLAVLAVSPESPSTIRDWARDRNTSLRLVAEGGPLLRKLGIAAFPTTVMLNADGTVRWNRSGILVPGELDLRL